MILNNIFGNSSRIQLLEELCENWGDYLSLEELSRMTDQSVDELVGHLRELESIGMIERLDSKVRLSMGDERCRLLSLIECNEYIRRMEIEIEKDRSLPEQIKKILEESGFDYPIYIREDKHENKL